MDLLPSMPMMQVDIPWIGDGPTMSVGASQSDAIWGQMVAITGQVSLQFVGAPGLPYSPKVIEFAGQVYYPDADGNAARILETPPLYSTLHYSGQDSIVGEPFLSAYADLPLGAPAIPNGNASFIGRS